MVAVAALAAAWDAGAVRARLPGPRRQVNEQWLHAFRGWVYGGGFGLQLGAGVATVVTTAAVYATLAAALLSASVVAGAAIGGIFGGLRGLALLAGAGIRTPSALVALDAWLRRTERGADLAAISGQALVALACAGALLR